MKRILLAIALLMPAFAGNAVSQPAVKSELEAMAGQMIVDAKALADSSLPKIELLGADWKRAWELPQGLAATVKSEDEYWMRATRNMGFAGMKPEDASKFIDQMLQQIGSAPGMTPRDELVAMMNMVQSSNAPSAQKQCDAYESASRTMATVAQQVMGGETRQQTAQNSQRRILDMAGAPYKSLDDNSLREALLKAMTLVQRRTYMEYYRSNNWGAVAQAGGADAAAKSGAWIGIVKLNLMLADESRLAEIMDLKPEDAPKLGPRLNSAMKAIVASMVAMEKKRLDDKYAERATNPAAQALGNKDLDEQRQRLDEQVAQFQKFNLAVAPKQFGDNSYVIRIDGASPDQLNVPVGIYTGWIRKGQAMVEISLAGSFPTEEMTREMDHFLSEMDAKLASYDSSLAGAFNVMTPVDLGPAIQAPTTTQPPETKNGQPLVTKPPGVIGEKPAKPVGDDEVKPLPPSQKANDPVIQGQLAKANQSYTSGDFNSARQQFDQILQADPGNVPAMMMRGASRYYLNDLEGAAADYAVVASTDPTNVKVRRYLAFAQMLTGKAKQAKTEVEAQLAQAPNDPELLLLRAQVAQALKDKDAARQWYAKTAAADPNRAATLYQEATYALTHGMSLIATVQFNSVLELNPGNYQAWYCIGQAETLQGRFKQAINAYKEYLKSDSTSQFAQNARSEMERLKKLVK